MNIAFLLNSFPTLSETFILNQVTGMLDLGHDVALYPSMRDPSEIVHADVERYRLPDKCRFSPDVPPGYVTRLAGAMRLLKRAGAEQRSVFLQSLNGFAHGRDAVSLRLLYDLSSLPAGAKYDVLLCHYGPQGNRAARWRRMGAVSGKVVTFFHGYDITQAIQWCGPHIYDELFRDGDLFLPVSRRWREKLIELGCDERKMAVHHMGIDSAQFAFKPRTREGQVTRLISIARLQEKKGIEYGIRAVASLIRKGVELEYEIVGEGPLEEELLQIVRESGAESCIRLLGARSQEEVRRRLSESHILLAPSVTASNGNQEGIPVAVMEAMAMGLPVLSTWHSGIPELVDDGVSGFLVPERDIEALEERLRMLVERPALWPGMGKAGRARIETEFDCKRLNRQLIEMVR